MRRVSPWPGILALARSAFLEVIRQPVCGLIVLATLGAMALGPAIAMFSLDDDRSLLLDFSASTLFLAGVLVAAFGASAVVGREIESRSALTLFSKPVGKAAFVLGKQLGVLAAVGAVLLIGALAALLAAREGPPRDIHDLADGPVLAGGLGAFLLAALAGAAISIRRRRPFGASAILAGLVTFPAGFALTASFDAGWQPQVFGRGFDPLLAEAAFLALAGVGVVTSISILLAALLRRGVILGTLLAFLAGLSLGEGSPFWLGFLPDLQLFWAGDAFYRGAVLPAGYLFRAALYAVSYSAACLALAAGLLERREVG